MVKAAIADGNINDCHRMSWDVPGQVQAGLGLGHPTTSCGIKLLNLVFSKGLKACLINHGEGGGEGGILQPKFIYSCT